MSRRGNPWIRLGFEAMALNIDAAAVIGLRTAKIATGGPAANTEAARMITEKIQAAWALQCLAFFGALGSTAPKIAANTLAHYRPKVRANRRRLSK